MLLLLLLLQRRRRFLGCGSGGGEVGGGGEFCNAGLIVPQYVLLLEHLFLCLYQMF